MKHQGNNPARVKESVRSKRARYTETLRSARKTGLVVGLFLGVIGTVYTFVIYQWLVS